MCLCVALLSGKQLANFAHWTPAKEDIKKGENQVKSVVTNNKNWPKKMQKEMVAVFPGKSYELLVYKKVSSKWAVRRMIFNQA